METTKYDGVYVGVRMGIMEKNMEFKGTVLGLYKDYKEQ